jgi:hypothetical protein
MMNLLDGWGFIRPCSSESEDLQQSMKVDQARNINCRRAKRQRGTRDRIKHPSGENDRHARFGLNDGNLSSGSPFSIELPDLAAIQRMPAVTDLYFLDEMGRMAPRLLWAGRRGCSPVRIAVGSGRR